MNTKWSTSSISPSILMPKTTVSSSWPIFTFNKCLQPQCWSTHRWRQCPSTLTQQPMMRFSGMSRSNYFSYIQIICDLTSGDIGGPIRAHWRHNGPSHGILHTQWRWNHLLSFKVGFIPLLWYWHIVFRFLMSLNLPKDVQVFANNRVCQCGSRKDWNTNHFFASHLFSIILKQPKLFAKCSSVFFQM